MKSKSKLGKSVMILADNSFFLDESSSDKINTINTIKRARVIRANDIEEINNRNLEEIYIQENDNNNLGEANENKIIKRKKSNDIDKKQIKRYFTKKKSQYFQQENCNTLKKKRSNTKIEKEIIDQIRDFKADCILYDKNSKTYIGKLFIDQSYTFYFSGEMNNKPLYFNSDYYIFPLLMISRCVTNSNYFGQSNYCKEITLKDYRNFIIKFSPNSFKEFNEIIDKFSLPEKSKNYLNYAYTYHNLLHSENSEKNENKKIKRKKSNDIDTKQIKRYITTKKSQYFQQENSNTLKRRRNNTKIEKGILEEIKDFKADCILYDKNSKTYIGKLFIDQSYTFYFSGEMNNKPLYFNSEYYIFPLLIFCNL